MYKVNDYVQVVCKCNEHCGEFGVVLVARENNLYSKMWYGVQLDNGKRDWFFHSEIMLAVEPTQEEPAVVINSGEEFDLKTTNESMKQVFLDGSLFTGAKFDNPTPSYYNYMYKGIKIDPYRITEIYGITNHAQQHAIKKLLRAGEKECNSIVKEIDEVIKSLVRWKEMIEEDSK